MTSVALESIIAIDGQRRLRRLGAACVVLLVCTLALFVTGFFDAQRFIEGAPAIQQLASEMVPPNFERWEHWVIPLRDTLAMSIAGTALTVLASLPLALVAAPNTPILGWWFDWMPNVQDPAHPAADCIGEGEGVRVDGRRWPVGGHEHFR